MGTAIKPTLSHGHPSPVRVRLMQRGKSAHADSLVCMHAPCMHAPRSAPDAKPCCRRARSKGEALRLLRKLVVARVLREETHRQDNQYGGVVSHLAVNEPVARTLAPGGPLLVTLPFLVKAPDEATAAGAAGDRASSGPAAAGKKKPAARRRASKKAAAGAGDAAAEVEVEVIEDDDDDAGDSGASQARFFLARGLWEGSTCGEDCCPARLLCMLLPQTLAPSL